MKVVKGNIESVRAVEDSIRATKRYTEGLLTRRRRHPIQGESFPSNTFTKIYEIYLDSDFPHWDDPAGKLIDWLKSRAIVIHFYYDYRNNVASVLGYNSNFKELGKVIPSFKRALYSINQENNSIIPGVSGLNNETKVS